MPQERHHPPLLPRIVRARADVWEADGEADITCEIM
jgi:hypothetical protein